MSLIDLLRMSSGNLKSGAAVFMADIFRKRCDTHGNAGSK